jgi:hypothetical protein
MSPTAAPSARSVPAMAFDPQRGATVLFGGSAGDSGDLATLGVASGDTWQWNGTTWTEAHPAQSPPARSAAAMAYDEARHEMVLAGGAASVALLGDTWTWDGTTWTPRASLLPPRALASMAYDAAHQQVVLFGGIATFSGIGGGPELADPGLLNDTWTWDGSSWTRMNPPTSPPGRFAGTLAPSPDGRLILFGGLTRTSKLDDTWAWDGATWTKLEPAHHPSGRGWAAMAYNASAHRTVLYGGAFTGTLPMEQPADAWAWDGTDWTERPGPTPGTRRAGGVAYDTARGEMVIFGGLRDSDHYLGDTWVDRRS